jgi:hypothetical protein
MSQPPVVWWYREVNCEIVGMCVEAVPVLGAESVPVCMIFYGDAALLVRPISCSGCGGVQKVQY